MSPDPLRVRLANLPRHLLRRLADRFMRYDRGTEPNEEYVRWSDVAAALAVPEGDGAQGTWRVGRKVGRTIYQQQGATPSDADPLIGVMDTRELARAAVDAYNAALRAVPAAEDEAAKIGRLVLHELELTRRTHPPPYEQHAPRCGACERRQMLQSWVDAARQGYGPDTALPKEAARAAAPQEPTP